MPLVYTDRVQETTSTTGTGALTLLGASATFQGFSVVGVGNTTYYVIVDATGGTWEVGVGTVGISSLTRDSVLASSNANALVNLGVGLKSVFVTSPATFFTTALSSISHALINHTGLPGVPAPEAFTAPVHAGTDHTGVSGVSANVPIKNQSLSTNIPLAPLTIYTIPANTLSLDGDSLDIEIWFDGLGAGAVNYNPLAISGTSLTTSQAPNNTTDRDQWAIHVVRSGAATGSFVAARRPFNTSYSSLNDDRGLFGPLAFSWAAPQSITVAASAINRFKIVYVRVEKRQAA